MPDSTGTAGNRFWRSDVPAAIFSAAEESQRIWRNGQPNDRRNNAHLAQAVATCAGVIDWAFSRAAKADGPYRRDAANFFGMAAACLDRNTVLHPVRVAGGYTLGAGSSVDAPQNCFLGGVDRDDYFPVAGYLTIPDRPAPATGTGQPAKCRYVRVTTWQGWEDDSSGAAPVKRGEIKAVAYDRNGGTIAVSSTDGRNLEIDLLQGRSVLPDKFLLRVFSPHGKVFTYTISFGYESLFPPLPAGQGLLDIVFCIDCSGSMSDDMEAVKRDLDALIDGTVGMCTAQGIRLQLGLVTYTRHDDATAFGDKWLRTWPLSADVVQIKANIRATEILGMGAGGGGWEDMYAALLCGMGARDLTGDAARRTQYGQPNGKGELVDMGWRQGACKICIPIGDEPPSDPDWLQRSADRVIRRAEILDPVHVYPLVVANPVESFIFGTRSAMERLATATGGRCVQVDTATALPQAIRTAVNRAIEDYRYEIWKHEHPPNRLFSLALWGGAGTLFLLALGIGFRVAKLRIGRGTVRCWLQIHGVPTGVREEVVRRSLTRIGAARDNDIVLVDPDAAAYHAEIRCTDGGLVLRGVSTDRPVYVNGVLVVEQVLQDQDRVRMGGTMVLVQTRN
jgi:hypothetical protein